MRGNVYRSGRRRTGSILLTVAAGIAVGVAVILASVSSAYAKATVAHRQAAKLAPVAHAAGHKIA